ncbi:MAG: hypothetical protein MJ003_01435 [Paludibacteraceae bacterium]|nr:hypothetical protein [Paludibacteraceae bacterium]
MKKIATTLFALLALYVCAFGAAGDLTISPANATVDKAVTLTYTPLANQTWMKSQPVYIYACVEFNSNGEWEKEKAAWSQCNVPALKCVLQGDGTLKYTISDIKSYFKLSDSEFEQVTGLFVILKNDKFQTTDKYVKLLKGNAKAAKFTGTVKFSVTVPAGTEKVFVTGTFGPEGSDKFWKHGDPKCQLKKVSETKFEGTITGVPENLEYLYVWGPRNDQTEFRMGHRPLGGRTAVNDIVEYWGDMTLTVSVPKGTREMYVSGSFNNWGFSRMMDEGNNSWTFHVAPSMLPKSTDTIEYKYYYKNDKSAGEKGAVHKVAFEGFATQYDEVRSWK